MTAAEQSALPEDRKINAINQRIFETSLDLIMALTALRESGNLWVTKPIDAEVLQRTVGELLTDTTRR